MKNYSISKTIALSLGVLAMSLLISFMVLAWTEPGVTPPEENVPGPLLSEPDDLNLAGATWNERSITNIKILSGFSELSLLGNSDATAPVHMSGLELKFYTGGTERMTINSSGNVGIGMISPQGKLEVQGDMWITFSGDDGLRIRPGLNAGYQYGFADQYGNLQAFINEQGITNQAFVLGDTSSTGTGILFGVSVGSGASNPSTGTETWIPRFAITGAGNVGIGTTAPGAKLEVAGQVKITGGSPGTGKVLTSDSTGLASWQTVTGGNGDALPSGISGQTLRHNGTSWVANSVLFNNGTNVGIGTTVPEWRLHAKDGFSWGSAIGVDATGTTGGRRWTMVSTGGTATEGQGKLLLKDETAGVARLTIDTAGNIGIGITSPIRPLHIKASAGRNIRLEEYGASYTEYFDIGIDSSGDLNIWRDDGSIALSILDTNGRVGIGTESPTQKLDVNGNIRVRTITNCNQLGTDSSGNLICTSLSCVADQGGTCELTGDCTGEWMCLGPYFDCLRSVECCCVPDVCLEQGSLILTPEGFQKIEELKAGDYVIGYKDGKEVEAKITETFVHDGEWTLYYYRDSWFTGDHRVSTDFENFEEVSKLTDVTKQYTGKVYNIEVAETENYFGENNLLIHNK